MSIPVGFTRVPLPFPEIIFFDPERIKRPAGTTGSRMKPSNCPAIQSFLRNTYVIRSPVDLDLRVRDAGDKFELMVPQERPQTLSHSDLMRLVALSGKGDVDAPDRPILQMKDSLVFFADDPVLMEQIPPVFHYTEPLPGVTISGQFDIYSWQRPLNWGFEFHDPSKPLRVKRGDPLSYVKFTYLKDPEEPVKLVPVKMYDALREHLQRIMGSQSFVRNTLSLFPLARRKRPRRLIR